MKRDTRSNENKGFLLSVAAAFLALALLVAVWLADSSFNKGDGAAPLDVQFFDGGDECTVLMICGGKVGIISNSTRPATDDLISSLRGRRARTIDLLIMPDGASTGGLDEYIADATKVLRPEECAGAIHFGNGEVSVVTDPENETSFFAALTHYDNKMLLNFGGAVLRGRSDLTDGAIFVQLPSGSGAADIEMIKELTSVRYCVICDRYDRPAGDDAAERLRGSGIGYICTRYGAVSVRSDGDDVKLLPDVSGVE